jgi:hypothetical protein
MSGSGACSGIVSCCTFTQNGCYGDNKKWNVPWKLVTEERERMPRRFCGWRSGLLGLLQAIEDASVYCMDSFKNDEIIMYIFKDKVF